MKPKTIFLSFAHSLNKKRLRSFYLTFQKNQEDRVIDETELKVKKKKTSFHVVFQNLVKRNWKSLLIIVLFITVAVLATIVFVYIPRR